MPSPTTKSAGLARRLGGSAYAVLAVAGLFALLEILLRAAGVAEPPSSSLRYQQVYVPILRPDALPDGREVMGTVDPRLPYQWIEPGTDVFRIGVFGGSAVAGLGSAPGATFARELETILRAAYPGEVIEVLNLGVVALASAQVAELVEDLAANGELDLVLIYSGNNEFLELHSQIFAELSGRSKGRAQKLLAQSRLVALLRGKRPEPTPEELERSVSTRNLADNDQRVDHSSMLAEVRIDVQQRLAVEGDFEANLRAMVSICRRERIPAVLCTVATNWRWTGLEDEDDAIWRAELDEDAEDDLVAACLERAKGNGDPLEQWRWLDRAARAAEAAGEGPRAAALFRAALDADPHLRRSTSRLAERVRAVAASEEGAHLFDADKVLGALAPEGIIGFETFYDYVHFTPAGSLATANALAAFLGREGLLMGSYAAPRGYMQSRQAFIDGEGLDSLAVRSFLGFGFDRELLDSRNLWRYDAMQDDLDARIESNPKDWQALGFRANVAFFRRTGAADAERDYRASLASRENAVVRENLNQLLSDRRP